jgi:hypothetical protein
MILLFYKNGWRLCSEKIRYVQHGEEITQYVGSEGHDWWVDFEEKWEHTEIIEFISVEPTQEQLDRFEEVVQLNIPDGFSGELGDYVEFGIFPEGFTHVLRPIQILKQQEEQDKYLIDLDFRQTLNEMGVDINDL